MYKSRESELVDLFYRSMASVDPLHFFPKSLSFREGAIFYNDKEYPVEGDLYLLSFGKASLKMAQGLIEGLPDLEFKKGLVVTHYEKSEVDYSFGDNIKLLYSSHPRFSEKSIDAGETVYKEMQGFREGDLVICLISGGGSAMMASPNEHISSEEKVKFLNEMLYSGVGEREVNVLRKALSKIKGGRLAERMSPAKILNFIISDEREHKLTAIASGPTVCNDDDPHPLRIIEEFELIEKVPPHILKIFKDMVIEKPIGESVDIASHLVATRELLVEEIKRTNPYEDFLYFGAVGPKNVENEKKRLIEAMKAFYLSSRAKSGLLLACGELPVIPEPNSMGGRNQQFALEVLNELEDSFSYEFCALATDGCDYLKGIHGATVKDLDFTPFKESKKSLSSAIEKTESYNFHSKIGTLVTGPYTGTNVSDFFLFSFVKS